MAAVIPYLFAVATGADVTAVGILGAVVALTIFISALDDYRYNQLILAALPDQDRRTAFFGSIYFTNLFLMLFK